MGITPVPRLAIGAFSSFLERPANGIDAAGDTGKFVFSALLLLKKYTGINLVAITGHQSTEEQEGFIRKKVFSEEVGAFTFSVAF